MSGHTRGPWSYTPHGAGESGCLVKRGDVIVAEVWPNVGGTEQRDNALLIAAAPELYGALQAMCKAYGGVICDPHEAFVLAIAALAKVQS